MFLRTTIKFNLVLPSTIYYEMSILLSWCRLYNVVDFTMLWFIYIYIYPIWKLAFALLMELNNSDFLLWTISVNELVWFKAWDLLEEKKHQYDVKCLFKIIFLIIIEIL
jgi:hypothetical protein